MDLLRIFSGARCISENSAMKREIEPDLNLGLSIGTCFAIEQRDLGILRSSSISSMEVLQNEPVFSSLVRTCSLPVDANEENRKRKEMQSLKRIEAKKKRTVKRSCFRSLMGFNGSGDFDESALEESDLSSLSNSSAVTSLPNHKPTVADSFSPWLKSLNSLQEDDKSMKRITCNSNRPKDMESNMMDEMPCVSVKGDGPNGRRIEGFLYKYRKGEEVRIVCVCHGNFLTPVEFVKHAGCGDVTHPLKHIVVSPSSVYY